MKGGRLMVRQQTEFGVRQYAIIGLTFTTAFIHFTLLFPDLVFILNALGYLVLVGALYLPVAGLLRYHNYIRWLLMAYTAVTIMLWANMLWLDMGGARSTLAYVDKMIEIALLALLWIDSQSPRQFS